MILLLSGACALHRVRYEGFIKNETARTETAKVIHGTIEESQPILERAQLPHNSRRQRYELEREAGRILRDQLGSQDYIVIGAVKGGGNALATPNTLKMALAKKAARYGGDVVLIFDAGMEERPYVYSTPSRSTTNVYGSAYRVGNYTYGRATAYTTHRPGRTYSGVHRFPYATGYVFKYVPGVEQERERISELSDADLERVLNEFDNMRSDEAITLDEMLTRWYDMIATAAKRRESTASVNE
ncbi:MAG: hypothetical protein IH986_12585 [Planctomycetes bacterium]|nr:hypothetical protein [Planctomycetota bacterium]